VRLSRITGENQLPALGWLRSVELGKHKALLAAIMRVAAQRDVSDYERALAIPYRLLADVEASAPQLTASVLAMPQFGAWADDCVRRLLAAPGTERPGLPPLATDLGHLALFAASAAMRAGSHFKISIPLRNGTACLPGLGTACPGAEHPWEWGVVRFDAAGCRVESSVASVMIPDHAGGNFAAAEYAAWRSIPRFTASRGGLRLAVLLDDADPFLDRYGSSPRVHVADEDLSAWQQLITAAWHVLAADGNPLAAVITGVVQTLVPIARPGPTRMADATETASFGAIALSLPPDALTMAEVLVHESHHAILSAFMDIEPLVLDSAGGPDFLTYAPWRDDPRPVGALLQGIFAHYGMGRFWREQYRPGRQHDRHTAPDLRAAVEFGRMRSMTDRACAGLEAAKGALTDAGVEFLSSIQAEISTWLTELLPAQALDHVADLTTDHQVRWRLSHQVPASEAVQALTEAWRRGTSPPLALDEIPVNIRPGALPKASANIRSYLLSLRYRNPGSLRSRLSDVTLPVDPADAALVLGDYAGAAVGYLRRIETLAAAGEPDKDAWAGLAIARRHTGPSSIAALYAERPEVISSVYALLSAGAGADQDRPHPDRLVNWLKEAS
jgi:HEXXH motif-containing protein